jgi:hypothetical protein
LGIVALTAGLAALLSSCGGGGLQGEPASQILSTAVTAASHAGAFRFVDKEGSGSQVRVLSGDTGTVVAQQTSSTDGVHLAASLVDGVAFVRASAVTLESLFGVSAAVATQESGKWVSVAKGEKGYKEIVQSLTPDAEFDPYIPQADLGVGRQTVLHGIPVIPVSGTAAASDSTSGLKAVATLFVSTRAPYLPVGGAVSGTDVNGRRQSEEVVFTKWGEKLHVSAPAGAVTLASLTG